MSKLELKKKYKILLACPTYDGKEYCIDYWITKIKALQKTTPCDILLVDNSKGDRYYKKLKGYGGIIVLKSKHYKKSIKSIGEAKKKLNRYLIENNYDFHFSIEQDLFPDKDILEELLKNFEQLKAKKAIIAAPYFYNSINNPKRPPFETLEFISSIAKGLIYSKKYKRKVQDIMLSKELESKRGLIKVFAAGFGCCLIPTTVTKDIKVKYSENNFKPDDAFFYQDCERLNIPVYANVNLTKKIKHIPGSNSPESNGLFSWTSKKKK